MLNKNLNIKVVQIKTSRIFMIASKITIIFYIANFLTKE